MVSRDKPSTHCLRGHELVKENRTDRGQCKICKAMLAKARKKQEELVDIVYNERVEKYRSKYAAS